MTKHLDASGRKISVGNTVAKRYHWSGDYDTFVVLKLLPQKVKVGGNHKNGWSFPETNHFPHDLFLVNK